MSILEYNEEEELKKIRASERRGGYDDGWNAGRIEGEAAGKIVGRIEGEAVGKKAGRIEGKKRSITGDFGRKRSGNRIAEKEDSEPKRYDNLKKLDSKSLYD